MAELKKPLKDFEPIDINISKEKLDRDNQTYINKLIYLKQPLTAAPTFIPRNFPDQIQFVLTGGNYYIYIYLTDTTPGTWKACQLT